MVPEVGPQYDHCYQTAVDWWEEALSSQPASFPSGPAPNLLCRILGVGILSQVGEFASVPILSETTMSLGLWAPSLDAIKSSFTAHCKLACIMSVHNLLIFLKECVRSFKNTLTKYDPKGVRASMHKPLSGAVMALQPLALDAKS